MALTGSHRRPSSLSLDRGLDHGVFQGRAGPPFKVVSALATRQRGRDDPTTFFCHFRVAPPLTRTPRKDKRQSRASGSTLMAPKMRPPQSAEPSTLLIQSHVSGMRCDALIIRGSGAQEAHPPATLRHPRHGQGKATRTAREARARRQPKVQGRPRYPGFWFC